MPPILPASLRLKAPPRLSLRLCRLQLPFPRLVCLCHYHYHPVQLRPRPCYLNLSINSISSFFSTSNTIQLAISRNFSTMSIHAVAHSLPHRGPGASRARARWQPYASNLSLASLSRSPAPIYLHTPASSISSISPSTVHLQPVSDIKVPPQQQPSLRDAQKTKYAAKLVGESPASYIE